MRALLVAASIGTIVWLAAIGHKIVVALLVQEVRGALADRLKRDIQDAVRPLPAELRKTYQEEWLGELDAAKDRPLKAVFMVRGYKKATREIISADPALAAAEAGTGLSERLIESAGLERLEIAIIKTLSPNHFGGLIFWQLFLFAVSVISVGALIWALFGAMILIYTVGAVVAAWLVLVFTSRS